MNKRLLKEIRHLYIQQTEKADLLDNDYLVYFDEQNINKLYTLIKAPKDSVYKHTFIRLDFDFPDNYPHSPPQVKFINYDSVRIHPNMYEDGKCCSTILNTWGDDIFEKWTSSMGIETILLTFHSFLDNNPYTYEPGGTDDPSYSVYVRHETWTSCLFRYLTYETIDLFIRFIHNYLLINIDEISLDLNALAIQNPYGYYFTRCFEVDNYIIDYNKIINSLQEYYNYLVYTEFVNDNNVLEQLDWNDFKNKEYSCNICFDTNIEDEQCAVKLTCGHAFHRNCLMEHFDKNNWLCPMCRKEINPIELEKEEELTNEQEKEKEQVIKWIINPLSKRQVKVGGKTWKYLVENDIIQDD